MVKGQVPALHLEPESRQAPELDALASILPMDRRARLVAEGLRTNGLLCRDGPHAPNTVERRLARWSTLHRWKGIEGPFAAPSLRSALRLAVRASPRPRQRKSKRAVTRDVLDRLIATCATNRLAHTRDLAILLLAFASGGRRRS